MLRGSTRKEVHSAPAHTVAQPDHFNIVLSILHKRVNKALFYIEANIVVSLHTLLAVANIASVKAQASKQLAQFL